MNGINTSLAMMQYNKLKSRVTATQNLDRLEDKALKEQTDNFEAIMVKQLLDDSLKAENSLFLKQTGADIYQSMYNDAVSKQVSGGFGFSQLLYDFLKDNKSQSAI